ncbi:MAG: DUF924 domain-containing protein [Rhodocyclaceae bacterium]|nr:DUF924 domain-containing protein [Rhodocyclaceae bacterium]MCB1962395.1 DUF924 domain-containing protein [Rhodocyclaceae bacterium]
MQPLPDSAGAVLDFWFGAPHDPVHGQQRALWFQKRKATDEAIRTAFLADIERALAGDLTHWTAVPRGALAHILLLDQFTRNVFRDTPRAFAGDTQALEIAQQCVDAGTHLALLPVERVFVYLPFEHAEDAHAQRVAVRLFEALAQAHPGFEDTLDYARRHQAVIARFGRFPHRNAILGRTSTAAEIAYLAEPGSGF